MNATTGVIGPVKKQEHVYPMVPAGAALDEMTLGVVGEASEEEGEPCSDN